MNAISPISHISPINPDTQPDLFAPVCPNQNHLPPVTDVQIQIFRAHLLAHGWQTRAQLSTALGLDPRTIRALAESLGPDIVRGQAGFKLTAQLDPRSHDLPIANAAADAAISQGKRMIRYGLALKKKLHSLIT